MEEQTFSEVVFDILHQGQKIHNYKTTTKAKKAMADQIEKLHLDLLNEAEDAIRDEIETVFSEFLPEPDSEEEEVEDGEKSEVAIEQVEGSSLFVQKIRKIFGK